MDLFLGDERNISLNEVLGDEMEGMDEIYIFLLIQILIHSVNIVIKRFLQLKMEKKGCQICVMEKMEKI